MTVERTTPEVSAARQKINNLIAMGIISSNVILFAVLYFMKMPYITSITVAIAGAVIVSVIEIAFIRTTIVRRSGNT